MLTDTEAMLDHGWHWRHIPQMVTLNWPHHDVEILRADHGDSKQRILSDLATSQMKMEHAMIRTLGNRTKKISLDIHLKRIISRS